MIASFKEYDEKYFAEIVMLEMKFCDDIFQTMRFPVKEDSPKELELAERLQAHLDFKDKVESELIMILPKAKDCEALTYSACGIIFNAMSDSVNDLMQKYGITQKIDYYSGSYNNAVVRTENGTEIEFDPSRENFMNILKEVKFDEYRFDNKSALYNKIEQYSNFLRNEYMNEALSIAISLADSVADITDAVAANNFCIAAEGIFNNYISRADLTSEVQAVMIEDIKDNFHDSTDETRVINMELAKEVLDINYVALELNVPNEIKKDFMSRLDIEPTDVNPEFVLMAGCQDRTIRAYLNDEVFFEVPLNTAENIAYENLANDYLMQNYNKTVESYIAKQLFEDAPKNKQDKQAER